MKLTPMTACITIGGRVLFGAVDDDRRISGSGGPGAPACVVVQKDLAGTVETAAAAAVVIEAFD